MKQKVMKASLGILWAMFTLTTFLLQSCDNGKEVTPAQGSGGSPFNPQLPISIKQISPANGAAGQKVLIYGENFGNDPSLIEVTIGGQKAPVVSAQSTVMHCIVPSKAYSGEIQVSIRQGENVYPAEVSEIKFEYQRQVVVSSLCGTTNEQGSNSAKDGPFSDCGSITNPCFMNWDPEDHNLLYDAEDAGDAEGVGQGIRCFDFTNKQVYTMIPKSSFVGSERCRTIDFYKDDNGEYHMIIGLAQGNVNGTAVMMFDRIEGGTKPCGFTWGNGRVIVQNQGCQAASIHPTTGDLYFSNFQSSLLYRVKKYVIEEFATGKRTTPVKPGTADDAAQTVLKVQDKEWEFNIMIHPTGKYAYFMVINRNYILRSDFNGEIFTAPYVIAGVNSAKDTYVYQDGVGNQARFGNPYSGVFVKNPKYAGNSDEYDFYLTDRHNHAIRILSPLGQVTTYAGRGSASLNSNPWGYANGRLREDARFNRPKGIAWDERDNTIYVGDANNYRIRKIGLEEDVLEEDINE